MLKKIKLKITNFKTKKTLNWIFEVLQLASVFYVLAEIPYIKNNIPCGWIIIASFSIIFKSYKDLNHYILNNSDNKRVSIKILYGDIFDKKYCKDSIVVIPIDDDFEENVEGVISPNSIQFQFIKNNPFFNPEEVRKGKSVVLCEKGSEKYMFLKVAKFDEDKLIYLNDIRDYVELIFELCEHINKKSKGRRVILPAIGSSIRFRKMNISSQSRLKLLKNVIETYSFDQRTEIEILLKEDKIIDNKYDFNKL